MDTAYTTHLICAPQLDAAATVGAILVAPGQNVTVDTPLLRLQIDGNTQDVCAPDAGLVGDFVVELHESVFPGDLLLTMEIEEKPTEIFPLLNDAPVFAPACLLPEPAPARTEGMLVVAPGAASLAARLALDLAEVPPGEDGIVDENAVTDYVRDILVRWQKLKNLLAD